MQRRKFLTLCGGATLACATARSTTARSTTAREARRRVDFHAHAITPTYAQGLVKLGIDARADEGFPLPSWSRDAHLKFMEEANVDFTVLSTPSPHLCNEDANLSCDVVRNVNEAYAQLCQEESENFGFVATLPLPFIDESLDEIAYAYDQLGALGVKVPSACRGIYLGNPALDPVFRVLNERAALVILHPGPALATPREGVVTGRVMALFEYPVDTTRAVLNMAAQGFFQKFPQIRFVVPHCGSFLPYMKSRANAMFKLLHSMNMMEPVDLDAALRGLYYDLAGDPTPDAMDMTLRIAESSRIVYGSDFPYVPAQILIEKKKALDAKLQTEGLTASVYVDNAAQLLRFA